MPEFVNTRVTMGETEAFDALIADEITDLKDNVVSTLCNYALYGRKTLQSIEMPSVTKISNYAMQNCTALESAKFEAATEIFVSAFEGDTALESADIPLCTEIRSYAFKGCESLNEIDIDGVTTLGGSAFEDAGVGKLEAPAVTSLGTYVGKGARMSTVDLTALSSVKANNFNGMNALVELILRNESLVTFDNTSAFTGTPIAAGIGYIYVPGDLVSTYKAASNWLNYASQIKSIEDYPLTFQNETITDSWAEILAAEEAGTYSTRYSVGDIKYVDVGGTKLPMQIVAFDTDDLAAGGKAKITWLSLCLLYHHVMNPTSTTRGGWAESAMRTWLREKVYPKIEATVRSAIKEVTKTYRTKSPNDATLSATDTVWIPSYREMGFTTASYKEGSGPDYSAFFTSNASRIKKLGQAGSGSNWWTRSAASATNFDGIYGASGASSIPLASESYGIALGFCT